MKFHWKLLLLFLLISIVPLVSLRMFGIHNVRIMADSLKTQVEQEQINDAKNRLTHILNGFSDAFGRIKEQVEMGMFFQISEVRRNLINHLPALPKTSKETIRAVPVDDSKPCLSFPPGVTNKHKDDIVDSLSDVYPVYHAVSQQTNSSAKNDLNRPFETMQRNRQKPSWSSS